MMLEECYTQEGAAQGGAGEFWARGATMRFRNQLKVPAKAAQCCVLRDTTERVCQRYHHC